MIVLTVVVYPAFVAVALTVNVPFAVKFILDLFVSSTAAPVSPAEVTVYATAASVGSFWSAPETNVI